MTWSPSEHTLPVDRPGARVIVADESGALLLLTATETLPDGRQRAIWFTPGGAAEGDETLPEAAVRELYEETGLALAPDRLSPPVAVREGLWRFRGITYAVRETHYFVQVPHWDVVSTGFTELELELLNGHRWWTLDELACTTATVFPPGLATLAARLLAGDLPDPAVRLPDVSS
jgi:8-oxo-dGTP pyrophosphatase MutT (NUDIX family)